MYEEGVMKADTIVTNIINPANQEKDIKKEHF